MKIIALNKAIKNTINNWLGPVMFVLLMVALYRQLAMQKNIHGSFSQIAAAFGNPLFWLAMLLSSVNWGLESLKWRRILSHLEPVGFLVAFRAVLAGTGVTMMTPNRTGEFAGRILFVSEKNRVTAISLTFLGSLSQLLITLIMGMVGLLLLRVDPFSSLVSKGNAMELLGDFLLLATSLLCTSLLLIFFQVGSFVNFLRRFRILSSLMKHVEVLLDFNRKQLLRILFLSFLRYWVFILQYVLLLIVFVPGMDLAASLVLLTVFYLIVTAVPSIGLAELPFRAAASVEIFGLLSSNVLGLQMAAFSIWCINLLIPATIGSLFLARVRIFQN